MNHVFDAFANPHNHKFINDSLKCECGSMDYVVYQGIVKGYVQRKPNGILPLPAIERDEWMLILCVHCGRLVDSMQCSNLHDADAAKN